MMIDFKGLVGGIVDGGDYAGREPAVEKEVIQHEILVSLSRSGLLDRVAFQGGTALRLCYGAPRLSEDLDFAAGSEFDGIDVDAVTQVLEDDLLDRYDVQVRVRRPKVLDGKSTEAVALRRWVIVVDTKTTRPDLPSQRMKLEVASVPYLTSEVMAIRAAFPQLPPSYGQTLVRCETLGEIVADKLVSFANSDKYVRYRDAWDIPWALSRPEVDLDEVGRLFEHKLSDYRCARDACEMAEVGIKRMAQVIEDKSFRFQLARFLSQKALDEVLGSEERRAAMVKSVQDAYRAVGRIRSTPSAADVRRSVHKAHAARESQPNTKRSYGRKV